MTKDLEVLAEEHKKNPEEPLWQLLARLGWVPPATAAGFREKIHELEGTHKVAADLVVGDTVRLEPRKIIAVGDLDFMYVALEDGTQLRFHRMDSVRTN